MSAKLQALQRSRESRSQKSSDDSEESISDSEESIDSSSSEDEAEEEEIKLSKGEIKISDVESEDDDQNCVITAGDHETKVEGSGMSDDYNRSLTFVCEALLDFSAEDSNDLSFSKGDLITITGIRQDGWWEARDQVGNKGVVPSQYLKVPDKIQPILDGMHSSGFPYEKGQLWEKVRHSVQQSQVVENAVTAFGALPIGFCHSTLGSLLREDPRYTTESFLTPKLRDSGLSFQDLQWCKSALMLKPINVNVQRVVRLVAFRQVIPPGTDFEIISRHVRICIHDGSKVLSNIHTIKAQWDPKTPKIWTFNPKISADGSCIEEGQFFIRSNAVSPTIGVLFQLCLSYTKISNGESGEISCGWVFMRLVDDSGVAVPSRTRILRIQPGVPFMGQLNSPASSGGKGTGLKLFMNRGKKPRLVVSILAVKKKANELLNFLPTTLIGPVSAIPLISIYRKILADKILKERASFDCTEFIHSPILSNFPKIFNQPDVLDVFRGWWSSKSKKLKQAAKYEEKKKTSFEQVFMETAFIILQCVSLPQYSLNDIQCKQRKTEIEQIMKLVKENGPHAAAMSSEYRFCPLSLRFLSINIVGGNSAPIEGIE